MSLLLHKGALLADPAGLLQGEGRYLRQIRYEDATANPDAVTAVVGSATANQTRL